MSKGRLKKWRKRAARILKMASVNPVAGEAYRLMFRRGGILNRFLLEAVNPPGGKTRKEQSQSASGRVSN